jgi:hypothetical protein
MKKRVRIYQEGGTQDPMQQMAAQQPTDDTQLIEGILQELGQGSSLADVNYKLVQGGVPQQKAQMLLGQVAAYLQQQKEDEAASLENSSQGDPEVDEAAAQAKADAEAVEQDEYNAQMQQMYAASQEGNSDNTDVDVQPMMSYGGVPSKKSFMKSYMDNYKKQQGGAKVDPSTDIPIDGRAEQLQKFLGAVKNTAEDAALREQAEQAYEQQMQASMLPFQQGGFTNQSSGLYKFFGGGEDPSIPQLDIDYTDSKNTADPYFKHGGLHQYQTAGETPKTDYTINPVTGKPWTTDEWGALSQKKEEAKPTSPFSAEQEKWFQENYGNTGQQQTGYPQAYYSGYNPYLSAAAPGFFGGNRPVQYAGSWAKMIGNPYMTGTDNPALNLMGPNTRISSIDVKKTGLLSNRPKKYTINFSNYLDNTAPTFTDKPGMTTAAAQQQAAASGPGVSPDADKYDGLNVRQAKRLARDFQTPDSNWQDDIKFQNPTTPIDDSQFPAPELDDPSKYKNLITAGPSAGFSPDPYSVMSNPGNAVIAPGNNKGQTPINYGGPMNIPQSVTEQAYGFAYGGYLPQAANGEEVTVYTSRPEFAGISNVQMTQKDIAPNTEFTAPQGSTFNWSGFSNQEVPQNNQQITDKTALATMNTQIDPNQANRDNLKKSVNEQKWSADFKTKNQWNIDSEAALNAFNAGARGLTNFIDNSRAAQKQNQYMQNNMNSDALFAANEHTNRGTYDTNSGLFRPDEMGFTGVAAYGGMFQDGGYYDQSDEVYMTEDEINDFLANGGELEYIND